MPPLWGISRQSREIFTTGDRASRRAALHLESAVLVYRLSKKSAITAATRAQPPAW